MARQHIEKLLLYMACVSGIGRVIKFRFNNTKHDFRLFKESETGINPSIEILADSGYQGIQKIHSNCIKPIKRTKKKPLTREDKKHNHDVGSRRVMVEQTIRKLKIFKIVADPYRNRRKSFGLRVNLITAIYNFEL